MTTAPLTTAEREAALKLIYRHTHKDFKSKISGKPNILICRVGTCLVPLDHLTDVEIAERLPYAQKKEAERLQRTDKGQKLGPIRHLYCCCCGRSFEGRQFFNQDTGHGLGDCCVDFCHRGMTDEEFTRTYGTAGIHYQLEG